MTTETKATEYPRTMDPRTIMFNEENPRSEIGDLSDILPSIKARLNDGLTPPIVTGKLLNRITSTGLS